MALEPWNQFLHLDKLKRTSWTPVKIKGSKPNGFIHQFVLKLQKFIEGAVHRCPWIATDLSPNTPLAHSPSAYRAIYTEWNGPSSIAHLGWPQTGGLPVVHV